MVVKLRCTFVCMLFDVVVGVAVTDGFDVVSVGMIVVDDIGVPVHYGNVDVAGAWFGDGYVADVVVVVAGVVVVYVYVYVVGVNIGCVVIGCIIVCFGDCEYSDDVVDVGVVIVDDDVYVVVVVYVRYTMMVVLTNCVYNIVWESCS